MVELIDEVIQRRSTGAPLQRLTQTSRIDRSTGFVSRPTWLKPCEVNWLSVNCSVEQLDASPAYRRCNRDGTWIVGVADQPAPVGGEGRPIWELVIEDMKSVNSAANDTGLRCVLEMGVWRWSTCTMSCSTRLCTAARSLRNAAQRLVRCAMRVTTLTVDYAIEVVKTINSKGTSQHPCSTKLFVDWRSVPMGSR